MYTGKLFDDIFAAVERAKDSSARSRSREKPAPTSEIEPAKEGEIGETEAHSPNNSRSRLV
jgi:hypothetical protein